MKKYSKSLTKYRHDNRQVDANGEINDEGQPDDQVHIYDELLQKTVTALADFLDSQSNNNGVRHHDIKPSNILVDLRRVSFNMIRTIYKTL